MGVRGVVDPSGSSLYFGVTGRVIGGSGTNYAVWGYASGSGTNYAGYFDGDVTVTGTFSNPSDRKFKENIQPVDDVLSKVNQLDVHTFEYKTYGEAKKLNLPQGQQIGFIAQELEKIYPELVSNQVHAWDRNDGLEDFEKDIEKINYKGVNQIGLIPVLTRAIQEQQVLIEDQQRQIDQLLTRVEDLERN